MPSFGLWAQGRSQWIDLRVAEMLKLDVLTAERPGGWCCRAGSPAAAGGKPSGAGQSHADAALRAMGEILPSGSVLSPPI